VRDRADTALHESVHACVAVALGRRVRWARVATRSIDGRTDLAERGAVSIDRGDELDRRDLVISLAPGLYEGSRVAFDSGASEFGVWPPLWPVLDGEGDRGQVSKMIRVLGISEAEYDDIVGQTRAILDGPMTQLWIARVAVRLQRTGHMTGTEVEACRPSTLIEEEAAA
jgi:hypothetical protein